MRWKLLGGLQIRKFRRLAQKLFEDLLKDLDTGALVLLKHSTHLELDIRLLSQYFPLTWMFKEQTNKAINYTMIRARNNYVRAALTNK